MKGLIAGTVAFLILAVAPAGAGAVDINVNTTEDEYGGGPSCSLREAIRSAQTNIAFGGCSAGSGADRILLPGGTYLITRAGAEEDGNATGDFDITGPNDLEIRPAGPDDRVIVDGNGLDRVFDKHGMGETTINSIRIRGGKLTAIEDGGGVRVSTGNLFLENVTVDGNETAHQGGGIAVYSTVHLTNSTVSGNRAGGSGGGLYAPGGSLVQARSTTIVDNVADADGNGTGVGGGFAELAATSVGFTNVINAGNSAAPPVGDARNNDCSSGPFYFPRYTLQSQLFGPADCLVGFDPGTNLVAQTPQYKPLAYNGGQTPTHDLLPGSLAIGNGGTVVPDACPPVDQNGYGRPAGQCDIGSVQFRPIPELRVVRILPKRKVIRRNRARPFTIVVRNVGTGPAVSVRVCVALPRTARRGLRVRGRPCRALGTLAINQVKRPKIRLAARPRARKRAYPVRIRVSGEGIRTQVRAIRVRVR